MNVKMSRHFCFNYAPLANKTVPVFSGLPTILHVVLQLGLSATSPKSRDDAVAEGEGDPLAVETDGQGGHVVGVGRVEARVLVAHGGDHVRNPLGSGHTSRILEGKLNCQKGPPSFIGNVT